MVGASSSAAGRQRADEPTRGEEERKRADEEEEGLSRPVPKQDPKEVQSNNQLLCLWCGRFLFVWGLIMCSIGRL